MSFRVRRKHPKANRCYYWPILAVYMIFGGIKKALKMGKAKVLLITETISGEILILNIIGILFICRRTKLLEVSKRTSESFCRYQFISCSSSAHSHKLSTANSFGRKTETSFKHVLRLTVSFDIHYMSIFTHPLLHNFAKMIKQNEELGYHPYFLPRIDARSPRKWTNFGTLFKCHGDEAAKKTDAYTQRRCIYVYVRHWATLHGRTICR